MIKRKENDEQLTPDDAPTVQEVENAVKMTIQAFRSAMVGEIATFPLPAEAIFMTYLDAFMAQRGAEPGDREVFTSASA